MRSTLRFGGWILALGLVTAIAAAPPGEAQPPGSWLGVRLENSGESGEGVKIALIMEDSPAHRAGLRAQDTILSVDGQPMHSAAEVIRAIQGQSAGAWVSLSLEREGEPWDLRLRLAERPTDVSQARALRGWLGVAAIDLPPALREHFGAPADAGVMISQVVEGSPAEAAGVELGDVIFEIDGQSVASPGRLTSLLSGSGIGNRVELRLARTGLEMVLEAIVETAPTPTAK